MGTMRVIVAEGTEGSLHLGHERPRVYSDLSRDEKDRYNADIRAINIILQELHQIQGTKPQFKTAVVVQNVQGRQNRGQGNNARGAGATGYGGAQNRVGNGILGQSRQTKCYNYNGIGHIARNCTQPKRPQNSEYFKDKMLLMQAQENRVALDEEQLLFIVGGQDNVVDEDMDEQPFQDLALNVNNVF
ncbi:retrovirus-related pol polyprotein from transposon TNT 1-94 [Tanacetum coccineum]